MAVKDYSTDPDANVQISGINIAEGCPPSGINNAIRQLMADVKEESEAQTSAISAGDDETLEEANAAIEQLANALRTGDLVQLDATLKQYMADNFLALVGGMMTAGGRIIWSSNPNHYITVAEDGDLLIGGSGALFRLRGLNSPENAGGFQLRMSDGNHSKYLIADIDNDILSWDGKRVVTVDSFNFLGSTSGNQSYIRFNIGLQICWGAVLDKTTVTFPKPFNSRPSVGVTHLMGSSSGVTVEQGAYVTNTTFYPKDNSSSGNSISYYTAVGSWA